MASESEQSEQNRQSIVEQGRKAIDDYKRIYKEEDVSIIDCVKRLVSDGEVSDAAAALVYWFKDRDRKHLPQDVNYFFRNTVDNRYADKPDSAAVQQLVEEAIAVMREQGPRGGDIPEPSVREMDSVPKGLRIEYLKLQTEAVKYFKNVEVRTAMQIQIWQESCRLGRFEEFAKEVLSEIGDDSLIGVPILAERIIDDLDKERDYDNWDSLSDGVDKVFDQIWRLYQSWERRKLGRQFRDVIEEKADERMELFAILPENYRKLAQDLEEKPDAIDLSAMIGERGNQIMSLIEGARHGSFSSTAEVTRKEILDIYPGLNRYDLEFLIALCYTDHKKDFARRSFAEIKNIVKDWEANTAIHPEVIEMIRMMWEYGDEFEFKKAILAAMIPKRLLEGVVRVKEDEQVERTPALITADNGKYLCPASEGYLFEAVKTGACVVIYSKEGRRLLLKLKGKVSALCLDEMNDSEGVLFRRGVWYSADAYTEQRMLEAFLRGEYEYPLTGRWTPAKYAQNSIEGLFGAETVIREAEIAADKIKNGQWVNLSGIQRITILANRELEEG